MKKRNHHIVFGSFLCIFIVLLGFSCNTLFFNRALNRVAKNSLSANNKQLAAHVSYRLKSGNEFVSDFADTISRMPDFLLTKDLLTRKSSSMELEGIMILSQNKVPLSSDGTPDLTSWTANHPEIWNKPLVSYIKDSYFIFSAPVIKKGTTKQVVIGIQSYQNIQSLVNDIHYHKDSINILLDTASKKRIMLKKGSGTSITNTEITEILNHLVEINYNPQKSMHDAFVSAEPISGTKWMQISIIPDGVLISEMTGYIIIYLSLIIVGFLLLAVGLYHFRKTALKREQYFLRDSLTDGYNRDGFLKAGSRLVKMNGYSSYAVACLNVCDFRHVNEMWGEESGNKMLSFIYRTLLENITEKELVCRSNMDHFIILLHENSETRIAERINQIITKINNIIPKKFGGYTLRFTIGSCCVSMTQNLNSAINNSFYVGKQNPEKNRCAFYNKETAQKIEEENSLNELFEESLKSHHFKVYLQPKVSTLKGKSCQAEALVRWQHPEKGTIYPNQFISMFEKNGKIGTLDLYMFEKVCQLIAGWIYAGKTVTKISVNISRYHLKNSGTDVWKKYKEIKEKYKIPDGVIEIELTETMLIDDTQLSFVKQVLDGFRSCGLNVALDDFGFAYSSLALLKEFEVDTLKLDRNFFINETKKSRTIVANVIQLAHNLDMCVVAEGIESKEQVSSLRENKCDLIQGYVYSPPLPVSKFEEWKVAYEEQ